MERRGPPPRRPARQWTASAAAAYLPKGQRGAARGERPGGPRCGGRGRPRTTPPGRRSRTRESPRSTPVWAALSNKRSSASWSEMERGSNPRPSPWQGGSIDPRGSLQTPDPLFRPASFHPIHRIRPCCRAVYYETFGPVRAFAKLPRPHAPQRKEQSPNPGVIHLTSF
jgi:hypothetical protein